MKRSAKNLLRAAAISWLLLLIGSFTVLSQTNSDSAPAVVQITSQMKFVPEKITIKVGQSVKWMSDAESGGPIHTVTTDPTMVTDRRHVSSPQGAGVFDSGVIKPGKSFVYKFTVPGVYNYACSPHEGSMRGQIVVEP
jgi:plastocyanin